jgi:hypothetical protein
MSQRRRPAGGPGGGRFSSEQRRRPEVGLDPDSQLARDLLLRQQLAGDFAPIVDEFAGGRARAKLSSPVSSKDIDRVGPVVGRSFDPLRHRINHILRVLRPDPDWPAESAVAAEVIRGRLAEMREQDPAAYATMLPTVEEEPGTMPAPVNSPVWRRFHPDAAASKPRLDVYDIPPRPVDG